MLTLWGRPSSFNVQKVLWTLDEIGLEYEHVDAGGAAGGLDTPAFLAMNPHGRVPVVRDDDGTIVWESQSVVRYLAARYSRGQLWPESPGQRAQADRWMDWSLCSLERDVLGVFWLLVRTPAEKHNRPLIDGHVAACARHYRLLDAWLRERPWLSGARFTMGDIPAGTTLYRYFEMQIERPEIPRVRDWYARLSERPGYRRHVMRPFDELRGKLGF